MNLHMIINYYIIKDYQKNKGDLTLHIINLLHSFIITHIEEYNVIMSLD